MRIYTVSFFGHRTLKHALTVEQEILRIVRDLLREKEYVEFLVGRNGEFDLLAASVVKRCQRLFRKDNSALIWMLPYDSAEYRDHEADYLDYYDDVEISRKAAGAHFKAAIRIRNQEMIDRSDLVLFCVERESGGAYHALQYAREKGIRFINLAKGEQS